ncbi:hypothetical protein DJICPGNB_02645 [Escherichia coli]|nr:hypothetical protein DJICPGNB_02645 [Escherichia coli]
MSTQYKTQGYTINNAGRRLVVDPITRIEGHMRCEVNINDQNNHHVALVVQCFAWRSSWWRPRDAGRSLNVSAASVLAYTPWLRFTPSKMPSVLKCRTTPISSATLCWQRSGATII